MMFDSEKRYYVYVWYIKENGNVFYVGKGSGNRCKTRTRKDNPAFNKITKNFDCDFKIIKEDLTEKEAFDLEIDMIAYYRGLGSPLINILDGGFNPPLLTGIPKSEEWKSKVRESHKFYFEKHPEVRKIRSEKLKKYLQTKEGKAFLEKSLEKRRTEEFRLMQSKRSIAANNTYEYKEKQSKIVKKMWKSEEYIEKHSGANNWRAQAVRQYDLNGKFMKEYETITQAYVETGINFSKISAVARGKRKTAGGYIWKFVNDKHLSFNNHPNRTKNNTACEIPILQFDTSGNFLMEYKSIAEAARVNNFNDRTNIISNLKGRTKTAYGYIWKYKQGNTVPSLN